MSGLLFVACRKDSDITTVTEVGSIPIELVESNIVGRVVDGSGYPVQDAKVKIGADIYTTNNKGVFISKRQLFDKNGTLVSVEAPNYFNAFRFAYPSAGAVSKMEIRMSAKTEVYDFNAGSGGTIQFNGGQVIIPANGVITESTGQLYTGQVKLYPVIYSASDRSMPGDLRATDNAGIARYLQSFGMVGIELRSPAGEVLQLASGTEATLSLDLTNTNATPPASIKMWHFNETTGYWVEEGSATLQGNQYVGKVNHFSFWNCDVPAEYVLLNGTVVLSSGIPYGSAIVQLESANYGIRSTLVNSDGTFGGLIPANESLVLKVFGSCAGIYFGQPIYTTTIGPFTQNTDLGNIEFTPNEDFYTVKCLVTDCAGAPLPFATIIPEGDSVLWYVGGITDANGYFEAVIPACATQDNDIRLRAINETAVLEGYSPVLSMTINDVTDFGTIEVCDLPDEYILFTVEGLNKVFLLNNYFNVDPTKNINGGAYSNANDTTSVSFALGNYDPVSQSAPVAGVYGALNPIGQPFNLYGCEFCTTCDCDPSLATATFTNYPNNIGEYAEGTITGQIRKNYTTQLVSFTITFRLKRSQ
jgi:hypothetical protein